MYNVGSTAKPVTLASVLASIFMAGNANAAAIDTTLAAPDHTVTFNEVVLAQNTAVTNQFAAYGVTFSGVFYDGNPTPLPLPSGEYVGGFSGHAVSNFISFGSGGGTVNPFSIFFSADIDEFAFLVVANTSLTTFRLLNDGVEVESHSLITTGSFNQISHAIGFTGVTFDQIEMTSGSPTLRFDTLQFSTATTDSDPIPEPSSGLLLAAGLIGWGGFRRRRRKA